MEIQELVSEEDCQTFDQGGVILRFEYIKMKNFRQYRDEHLDLSNWSPTKNVTVIQGAMGSGKTNVLNAITWCLFGDEKHLTSKSSKGLDLYNTATASEVRTGDTLEVEVEIAILDAEGTNVYIKRLRKFEKGYQGQIDAIPYDVMGEQFETMFFVDRIVDGEMKRERNPSSFVQRLIPEELSLYFLFDGEKLYEYFDEQSVSIPEAVETISQIDLLDRVIQHLRVAQGEMVRKRKGDPDEVQDLQKRHDEYEKKIDDENEAIEKLKDSKRKKESRIKELDRILVEGSAGALRIKARQREQAERDIAVWSRKLKDLKKDRLSLCLRWGANAFTVGAMERTIELIHAAKHAGKLPAAFKKDFLEKLLRDEKCICGSSLKKSSKHRRDIERLLRTSDNLSNLSEDLAELSGRLRTTLEQIPGTYDQLVRLRRNVRTTEDEIGVFQEKKIVLERELKDADIEEISKAERERQSLRQQSEAIQAQIALKQNSIATYERYMTEISNKITRAMNRDKKYKADLEKRKLCERTIELAEQIKQETVDELRKEIEKLTGKHFIDMHWKKKAFKSVAISPDYSVSVKDNRNQEALATLSKGETQMLAYAFVVGLNIVSGFEFPLIIDTPLGRISSEPREALGRTLSKLLKGRQIVFLMTDVEYTSDFRKTLKQSVNAEYEIDFTELEHGCQAKLVSTHG